MPLLPSRPEPRFCLRFLGLDLGLLRRLGLGLRLLWSLRGLTLLFELLDPRVDDADEIAHRSREQADDGRQRAGERAHELGPEHIGRRELRETLDVVGADLRAFEEAAPDDEDVSLTRVVERLRDRDRVAVGLEECDRRRPVEERDQTLDSSRLGGTLRERVLDDREPRALLDQLAAQLVDLRDGEPAVVRDDQRLGRAQPLGELLDQSLFLGSVHSVAPLKRIDPPRGGSGREGSDAFD